MAEVEIVHIQKRFGQVPAVRDVTLTVPDGAFFSLLGPSGCGKTTILRMVAGFLRPTAGTIQIDARDVIGLPPEKRDIGIVFQNYALFPHMTVNDNIAFGLKMRKVPKVDIAQQVHTALEQVGLTGYGNRYPRELSGGEQQRVALARVLVTHPKVLLLDEPLSALDKKLREQMQFWIKDLQHRLGITTIYVTHDQAEAITMSDLIAVMNRGLVEQIGKPRDIYDFPRTRFVSNFIGESNVLAGKVMSTAGQHAEVALDGVRVHTRTSDSVASGQEVSIAVRPENILLDRETEILSTNKLRGTVKKATFRGSIVRYLIALTTGAEIVAESHGTAEGEFHEGDTLDVGWKPEHASILSD